MRAYTINWKQLFSLLVFIPAYSKRNASCLITLSDIMHFCGSSFFFLPQITLLFTDTPAIKSVRLLWQKKKKPCCASLGGKYLSIHRWLLSPRYDLVTPFQVRLTCSQVAVIRWSAMLAAQAPQQPRGKQNSLFQLTASLVLDETRHKSQQSCIPCMNSKKQWGKTLIVHHKNV